MPLDWYLAWYNLIFAAPFTLALLYLLVYAVSGVTFGETEADVEAEADVDAHADIDADHDVDMEADHDVDVDADHDADVDAEHDAEAAPSGDAKVIGTDHIATHPPHGEVRHGAETVTAIDVPFYLRALRFVGVGRVPLSILLMVGFFLWGFLGVATNLVVQPVPLLAEVSWLVSIPVAFLGSLFGTRGLSLVLGRFMPTTETYVRGRAALVGRTGEAVLPIDAGFGLAVVRDQQGNSHRVACRVYPNAQPIAKGAVVLLVDYDPKDQSYYAIVSDVPV